VLSSVTSRNSSSTARSPIVPWSPTSKLNGVAVSPPPGPTRRLRTVASEPWPTNRTSSCCESARYAGELPGETNGDASCADNPPSPSMRRPITACPPLLIPPAASLIVKLVT